MRVAYEQGHLSERRACGLVGMNRGSWRTTRESETKQGYGADCWN